MKKIVILCIATLLSCVSPERYSRNHVSDTQDYIPYIVPIDSTQNANDILRKIIVEKNTILFALNKISKKLDYVEQRTTIYISGQNNYNKSELINETLLMQEEMRKIEATTFIAPLDESKINVKITKDLQEISNNTKKH